MVLKQNVPKKVDLDYILTHHLGELGWYQQRTILLIALPVMFISFGAEWIFSASKLTTRCLIPGCDEPLPEMSPSWLLNAVPRSATEFDNCFRYAFNVSSQSRTNASSGNCPSDMFDRSRLVPCEEYVYERTNSLVYDFGIECDEWMRSLAGNMNSIGYLLALPVTGYISDRWGRKLALCLAAFNYAWISFLRAFSVNYTMYFVLHFVATFVGAGTFSCCHLFGTELVGAKYRVLVGVTISTLFAIGEIILGLIAWAIPDWRKLCMVLFAPQFLIILYFWILAESVRWLISNQKYDEAKKILLKVAEVNKTKIPEEVIDSFMKNSNVPKKDEEKVNTTWLVIELFKSPIMLRRCLTTPVWWLTATFVYYGMTINSVSLVGNMYSNYVLVAAVEIPGYWSAIFLLNKIGRKITLCLAFITCAVCCIAFPFIPTSLTGVSLFLYLVSKMSISLVFTSIYLYTAELYPTRHRHTLVAFSSMVGRIGSIIAPLTPALMIYWKGIPSIMFGIMSFISGLLVLTTPETLGTTLPDTIEEAEAIGRKSAV